MMTPSSQTESLVGSPSDTHRAAHVGRRLQEDPFSLSTHPEIIVARWTDKSTEDRLKAVVAPDDQFVLGVALTPTRVRLRSGPAMVFDGVMVSGMTYVCRPSQTLHVEFLGPADLLHLYVADGSIKKQHIADTNTAVDSKEFLATMLSRDALIDQLARAVRGVEDGADESYVETLARAIVMRTTQIRPKSPRVSSLPRWRLKRVMNYVEDHISEAISLGDMAAAAGLSRTHFTAQFRIATGCKPHDFILLQRIEAAKRLLVGSSRELLDIALMVGFQTQAHFSTVFKRYVSETPARWRRAQLAEASHRQKAA